MRSFWAHLSLHPSLGFLRPPIECKSKDCALFFCRCVQTKDGKRMKEISKEFSAKVVNMSLLCALLVVSIHCGYSKADGGICWWVHQIFSGGYSTIAVPFFFIISGYFIAGHFAEKGWWESETSKRIKTLIVPFLSWALLYQVLFIPLSIYADLRAGRPFGTNISLFNGNALAVFGLELDKWPNSVPLWYLRALFMYVLVSKGVLKIVRAFPKTWLIGLFIFSWLLSFAPDPKEGGVSGLLQHSFSIGGLMYFSFGMWARERGVSFGSRKSAILSLSIALLLLIVKIVLAYNTIETKLPINTIAIPLFIYSTWYFMPTSKLPNVLKGTSFPIYLMHSLFLGYWGIFAKNVNINESLTKVMAWPMAFVGSIILANILKRYLPRFAAIVFGGR